MNMYLHLTREAGSFTQQTGFYPLLLTLLLSPDVLEKPASLMLGAKKKKKTNCLPTPWLNMHDIKAQHSTIYLSTLMQSQGNHSTPLKPK